MHLSYCSNSHVSILKTYLTEEILGFCNYLLSAHYQTKFQHLYAF